MNALQTIETKFRHAERAEVNGQFHRAAQLFRQLSSSAPAEPLFHWKLAYALMEMQDYQGAIREFRQALKLDPRNIAVWGGLGRVYMELGKWSQAENAFRKRLALKRSPQQFVFLAHVLMMRHQPRVAAVMCRRAIALDPEFSEAYLNLGLAYRQEKKLKRAVSAFQKAIALDRLCADGFRELGWTSYALGEFDTARKMLEHGLSINGKDAWAHLYLALVCERSGDTKSAAKHFRAAIKIDENNRVFRDQYSEFLRQSAPPNSNGQLLTGRRQRRQYS